RRRRRHRQRTELVVLGNRLGARRRRYQGRGGGHADHLNNPAARARPDTEKSSTCDEIVTPTGATIARSIVATMQPILFEPVESPHLVPYDGSFRVARARTEPPAEAPGKRENQKALEEAIARISKAQAK